MDFLDVSKDSFVELKTMFHGNERNFEALSKIYENIELLRNSITEIIGNKIDFRAKKVLIKPNWVLHAKKDTDHYALYTHPNFILALVDIICRSQPSLITIGDAPVQDCIWEKLHSKLFLEEIKKRSTISGIPIIIKDFRRVTYNFENHILVENKNPIENYHIFDLGNMSKLEPITIAGKNNFRVTNYNPSRMKMAHQKGMHKYCITKDFFNHDIILTLPKIKTHQKAGLTGALKILVGINGDKDFLPHHRIGGINNHGDCYPGNNIFRIATERVVDLINHFRGTLFYKISKSFVFRFWNLFLRTPYHSLSAGWYGNDTVWRMVYDLNTIATYGKKDGSFSHIKQREIYSLSDGIIGGEGNGPLHPDPLNLGVIMFSNCPVLNDAAVAKLMKFDLNKVPIIKEIKPEKLNLGTISIDSKKGSLNTLDSYSIGTEPSPGWKGHLEI